MTTDLTYSERSAIADHQADTERFRRIKQLFEKFGQGSQTIEKSTIAAVNIARDIGLELQGIAGSEQLGFSFFKTHCEDSLPFNFETAQRFVAVARKSPEKVTTMVEAAPVIQQVLFAANLLELPDKRDQPQISHDSTPVTFVFHTLGTAWERIENKMRDLPKWDDMTRESVRHEIERFEKKAVELKAKL